MFFCLNEREGKDCRPSCGKHGAEAAQKHAKQRIKELGLNGHGKVRINQAGCLDRCEEGPVVVVYPQGTWYTYVDNTDIDEIIDRHLVKRRSRRAPENLIHCYEQAIRKRFYLTGPAGQMECVLDQPDGLRAPRGIALVAHPHPLYGGTMDNKVAQTLARAFVGLGYVTARFNFRGVGESEGVHDDGRGEVGRHGIHARPHGATSIPACRSRWPASRSAPSCRPSCSSAWPPQGRPAERLVLVGHRGRQVADADGPGRHHPDPRRTRRHHPPEDVFDWARPLDIPVIVIPGADHFFHRKLGHIKNLVTQLWRRDI